MALSPGEPPGFSLFSPLLPGKISRSIASLETRLERLSSLWGQVTHWTRQVAVPWMADHSTELLAGALVLAVVGAIVVLVFSSRKETPAHLLDQEPLWKERLHMQEAPVRFDEDENALMLKTLVVYQRQCPEFYRILAAVLEHFSVEELMRDPELARAFTLLSERAPSQQREGPDSHVKGAMVTLVRSLVSRPDVQEACGASLSRQADAFLETL